MQPGIQGKTAEIIQFFREISQIPRCSKQEQRIGQWLVDWAHSHRVTTKRDEAGNVLLKIPATRGYESSPPVVLQGHLDMVCEKEPDSPHDFSSDPLELVFEEGWLRANGTTLGADNGVAIALGLALANDTRTEHPPLELLYTVEEEIGLQGVEKLQPDFVEGRILLNLDSEEEGGLILGCAGAQATHISLPLQYENLPRNYRPFWLRAGNMRGGHSGVDIHRQHANAIQALARVLDTLIQDEDVRISYLHGGTVGNAIPRDAEAIVLLTNEHLSRYESQVAEMESTLRSEYQQTDPDLRMTLEPYQDTHDSRAITRDCTRHAIDVLLALPHGVTEMSSDIENLVETSSNLATMTIREGSLQVQTSQRSSVWSRLLAHTKRIEAIARLAGADAESSEWAPPWQPNWESPLAELCQKVYQEVFQEPPTVTAIHAGLECRAIGEKFPGMDMISFGPTIHHPHSPQERLDIASVGKVWDFLVEVLKALK